MVLVLNMVALLLLSLGVGGGGREASGVQGLVYDRELRALLLEGRLPEYHARLDARLGELLAADLRARLPRERSVTGAQVLARVQAGPRAEPGGLWATLKSGLVLATFLAELQTLGPADALRQAVEWVGTGLARRAGLHPESLRSYHQILSHPGRPQLDAADRAALAEDLAGARSSLGGAYRRILGSLAEELF